MAQACHQARVSERTFYNWKPRFEAGGYEALQKFEALGPKEPQRTSPEVEQRVIGLKRAHPDWGKERIAHELAKLNNWMPLVSPNTVRRVLVDAGLWPPSQMAEKKTTFESVSRTAEEPGQTLNVDLCFVPAEHQTQQKLPAVSGSSGRLVVAPGRREAIEPDHPGRVFAEAGLDYVTAMTEFVARSQAEPSRVGEQVDQIKGQATDHKAQKQALRQEQAALTPQRRQWRQQRRQEDEAWQQLKAARRQQLHRQVGQRAAWGSRKTVDEYWGHLRQ